jgi:hypothetical protein
MGPMPRVRQIHLPGRDVGLATRLIDRVERTTTLAVPPSSVWRDVVTGAEYASIAGGIAWPAHPETGALVVVGLKWEPGNTRTFHVLAEFAHDNLFELVAKYLGLSDTWALDGPGRWFGPYEPEPIYSLAGRCCRDAGRLLLMSDLAFKQDDRWSTYCNQIFDAVGKSATLYVGDNRALADEGAKFTTTWRGHVLPEPAHYPRMAALGRALEGLGLPQPPRGIVTVPGQAYGDPWEDAARGSHTPAPDELISTSPNFDALTEVFS